MLTTLLDIPAGKEIELFLFYWHFASHSTFLCHLSKLNSGILNFWGIDSSMVPWTDEICFQTWTQQHPELTPPYLSQFLSLIAWPVSVSLSLNSSSHLSFSSLLYHILYSCMLSPLLLCLPLTKAKSSNYTVPRLILCLCCLCLIVLLFWSSCCLCVF